MQIYRKGFAFLIILLALTQGCSKDLAPLTIQDVPGKSQRKVNREQRRRGRRAFWYDRRNKRVVRKTERKMERLKRENIRAEKKLQQDHIKKQTPEVQKRMKETKKESEQNTPKRTLRQKFRFWRFKK
ncbi:MAG: hypothetical protein AB7S48_13885 [Bacteroidales bacterium]